VSEFGQGGEKSD